MSTTIELPEDVVRGIRRLADEQGRGVNETAADLLRVVLAPPTTNTNAGQVVAKTLPAIEARPTSSGNASNLTAQEFADWIKQVDLDMDVERYETTFGHQHVDRAQS